MSKNIKLLQDLINLKTSMDYVGCVCVCVDMCACVYEGVRDIY